MYYYILDYTSFKKIHYISNPWCLWIWFYLESLWVWECSSAGGVLACHEYGTCA